MRMTNGSIALIASIAVCLFVAGHLPTTWARTTDSFPVPTKTEFVADTAITVNVTNVKERKGILNVYLFTKSDGFPTNPKNAFAAKRINLSELGSDTALSSLSVTFAGLTAGYYAVGVHHDKNGNGKVDSNFLGIPKEPVGCSNNVRPKFRAPHFDEAHFSVVANETKVLSIEVK